MSRAASIGLAAVAAAAIVGGLLAWRHFHADAEGASYAEVLDHGTRLEQEERAGEAIGVYDTALEDPARSKDEQAELRYRLARSQIHGNDLNGALGTLQDLLENDVKRLSIDVGPLYLELGDRFLKAGDKVMAKNAWMLGRGASPLRFEEFSRRLEQLLPPEEEKTDGK